MSTRKERFLEPETISKQATYTEPGRPQEQLALGASAANQSFFTCARRLGTKLHFFGLQPINIFYVKISPVHN